MTNGQFPVPSETVEAGLLHSCLTTDQWLELGAFTDDDFSTHRNIYQFYKDYLSQYGTLPNQNVVSSRFNWQPPIGEFRYWLTEMKRYSLARKVLTVIQDGYQQVSDPEKALSLMLSRLSVIRSQQSNHVQATDASAADRLERFDYRTEEIFRKKQMVGIRTGLKILDDTLVGYTAGNLVVCYARPGLGKTWWLLWSGMNAWIDGYTVLAIMPEMPANWTNLRVDVLAGAALGHPIDYQKLLTGDPSIRTAYELITKAQAQSNRWWTYDSVEGHSISIGDIAALIKQHSPDIVLVDGISLLKDTRGGQTWEQVKNLCYDAKNLATIYEVPIIMTHQAVNSNRGRRSEEEKISRGDDFNMPNLNDAAYGDAVVQACSDIITMCADKESPYINWYSFRKTRDRGWEKPIEARYGMAVDYGAGKIYDLSEFGYNPARVGLETKNLLGKF